VADSVHSLVEVAGALRERLAQPLPGSSAQLEMAPRGRQLVEPSVARRGGAIDAAALVLLFPKGSDDAPHCALTVRSRDLRHHPGQVSLPGGRMDAGETATEAALREVNEELAVSRGELDVLGSLTPIYVPPSSYVVQPLVAAALRRPRFEPHPAEVAELIEAPLRLFVGDANRHTEWQLTDGREREVRYFDVLGHQVWGATAMILSELAAVYSDAVRELTAR